GITTQIKERLIQQARERRLHRADQPEARSDPADREALSIADVPEKYYRFRLHPGYQQLRIINDGAARLGVSSPFFKVHDGVAGVTTRITGRADLTVASYNYLGLSGEPAVNEAAKAAIDRYGTSVSASRLV